MAQSGTSLSIPSRIPPQIRRHIQRTKHKPAPITAGNRDTHTPVPATRPTLLRTAASGRSDTVPSPKARTLPKSIPNKVRRPNVHPCKEPNPIQHSVPKPNRSPGCLSMNHCYRDPAIPRSSRSCAAGPSNCQSSGRDRCSIGPNHPGSALHQSDTASARPSPES